MDIPHMPVTHQGQTRNIRSNDRTRYEMVAERDGTRRLLGYTTRPSVDCLYSEIVAARLALLDGAESATVEKSDKGRGTSYTVNGWTIGYSGRTEREAVQVGELRSI